MQVINKVYSTICCQNRVSFPDPYIFQFGDESVLKGNAQIFSSNFIQTTKYRIYNFLPKAIINQYKRIANFYFLMIAIISTIPNVSTLTPFFIWLPLTIVLIISLLKEAYQDYHRYRVDRQINDKTCTHVLRNNQIRQITWKEVIVGDICLIKEGEMFPADIILISCSNTQNVAFIETASLDGEKTSKIRYCFEELNQTYREIEQISKIKGQFVGEIPSQNLDTFRAFLNINHKRYSIVDNRQLMYRGAKLKNTQYVWGVAAYTGNCTKIMLNSQSSRNKLSNVETLLNYMLIVLFIIQVVICIIATILYVRDPSQNIKGDHYLHKKKFASRSTDISMNFLNFFITYSSLIPISLIISMEIVKLLQSYFIDFDKFMYSSSKKIGSVAKNTNIIEELGQIQYVFTDKTGTLTCNKMKFHSAVLGNNLYPLELVEEHKIYTSQRLQELRKNGKRNKLDYPMLLQSKDKRVEIIIDDEFTLYHHYLMALLVCNNISTVQNNNMLVYESESPDELPIIELAKSMGYIFLRRSPNSIQVKINKSIHNIFILEKFNFTSDRKRMSVLIKFNEQLILYTKGADNVIQQRINETFFDVQKQLTNLSKTGLRTLMVTMKLVSERQYKIFQDELAYTPLQMRDQVMEKYSKIFESEMSLLGGTALLDQLQAGVPEVLKDLQRAKIKVWMLTGDKLQTAVQIGKSCNLIAPDYRVIYFPDKKTPYEFLIETQAVISRSPDDKFCLVIEGSKLSTLISNDKYEQCFAELSQHFKSVICCRMLPIQKATVVKLIKDRLDKICLAIGDGGNDVSMIKQANVGIGLYGEQGMNAVQASDFALPEFRMLWRLLFMHGRWNYMRISEMILYFLYKSILFTAPRMVFEYYNGFSGQMIFDESFIALFNLLFTSVPLIVKALLQQDVNYIMRSEDSQQNNNENTESNDLLASFEQRQVPPGLKINVKLRKLFPYIYFVGKKGTIFNVWTILAWSLQATLIATMVSIFAFNSIGGKSIDKDGHNSDLWIISLTIFSAIIIISNMKLAMHVKHWTRLLIFSMIFTSFVPYIGFLWVTNFVIARYVQRTAIMAFKCGLTYFVVIYVTILMMLITSNLIYISFKRMGLVEHIHNVMHDVKIQQIEMEMSSKHQKTVISCIDFEEYLRDYPEVRGSVAHMADKKQQINTF